MTSLTFTDLHGQTVTVEGELRLIDLTQVDLAAPITIDGRQMMIVRVADSALLSYTQGSEATPWAPPPIDGRLFARSLRTPGDLPTLPEIVLDGVDVHRPSALLPSARWEGPAPRRARRAKR